jgi:protein tyrosine phosphatase (PTP) superfamily phosphohydrolase (DUF442 family)
MRVQTSQGEPVEEQNRLTEVLGAIPNAACPLPGLATAGQPSAAAWSQLADAGYRTVVDLRATEEPRGHDEPASVRAAGLEYVAIPVSQPTLGDAGFDRFRDVIRAPERRPIFVHCATSNRVGALLLPYFALDEGMPLADATRLAHSAGLRNPELQSIAVDYARRHGAR